MNNPNPLYRQGTVGRHATQLTNHCVKMLGVPLSCLCRLALAAGICLTPTLRAQVATNLATAYRVVDLGALPGGVDISYAQAVNDVGQVIGESGEVAGGPADYQGFFWDTTNGMVGLGNFGSWSYVYGLNDQGTVVGCSGDPSSYLPFSWSLTGGLQDLGAIAGYSAGRVTGISDSGAISCDYFDYDVGNSGHTYLLANGITNWIGSISQDSWTWSQAMNNKNEIIGFIGPPPDEAFFWSPSAGIVGLGSMEGYTNSQAAGINDASQVVGACSNPNGTSAAFIWTSEAGMAQLPLGVTGGSNYFAYHINSGGIVCGDCQIAGANRAVAWPPGKDAVDLNTLVPDLTGWVSILAATAMNSAGVIVGSGLRSNGVTHACILYPLAAPAITVQPTNQTVMAGMTVTFQVVATGSGPLSYQWFFNHTNALAGATNATLTMNNAQLADAGSYSVLVTNSVGAISTFATLTVDLPCYPAPSGIVAWWPGNGNANDIIGGHDGQLVGGVTYADGLCQQAFSFDGSGTVRIADAPDLDFGPSGAITIELWAYRTGTADPEHFIGKRSGCAQGTDSINYQMAFNVPAGQGLVCEGVTTGYPMPMMSWHHLVGVFDGTNGDFYLDGQLIGSGIGTNGPINSAPLLLGGSGDCADFEGLMQNIRIYNRSLSESEVASLYRAGCTGVCLPGKGVPASILAQPTNQTVVYGSTVSYVVVAGGSQPLWYQWSFNQTNVLAGATNATLTLTNAQPGNAGGYSVVVTNSAGSVTSLVATLTVLGPPNITIQPANQTVVAGGTASFQVIASGSGPLSYQWFFNRTNPLSGATSATLTMANIQPTNAGAYFVVVTNLAGMVSSSNVLLTVLVTPRVSITQPADGAAFLAGANITLIAEVSDPGSTVTSVQFFEGGANLLGVVANAPYSVVWTNVRAGSYALTARAMDDYGTVGVSAVVGITVTNPAPPAMAVGITSPADFASFCLGHAVRIEAAVTNAAGSAKVDFYAGNALLGSAASSPYQWDWPSPEVGTYEVWARVSDTQGHSANSARVSVTIAAQCADVGIIGAQADPEINAMQTYLFEMGLGSQVFDQAGLVLSQLQGFKLVIWNDLGLLTNGLSANTVDLLSQLYANGMPLYLAGEHLASSVALLPPAQQAAWTNLTHLSAAAGTGGDGTIAVTNPEGPSNPILFGTYGAVTNFPYPGRVDLATILAPNVEVYGTTAGSSALAALPGVGQADQSPTHLWLQNVRILPPDSPSSDGPLKALFQNAVCWLTGCAQCKDVGVMLTGVQSNDVVEAGQVVNYTLTAAFNGECPPTGVTLTNQLPAGFQFLSATSEHGSWMYDGAEGQVVFFLGVMPQDTSVNLGISAVALQPGTFTNTATVLFNASARGLVVLDPALVTTVVANTSLPPVLTLTPLARPNLLLGLSGQSGIHYEVDSSTDLKRWTSVTNVLGPTWTQTLAPGSGANTPALFYRAKIAQ